MKYTLLLILFSMDWKNLKEQATTLTRQATDMAKKWFETSKEYAEKTGDFSYAKLKESKFTLKTIADYETLKKEKRYAIFCIRDNEEFTKFFLTILPVLLTKSWIESWSIRIIIEEGSEELRTSLNIETIPSVLLKTKDEPIRYITTEAAIRTFIRDFSFYTK